MTRREVTGRKPGASNHLVDGSAKPPPDGSANDKPTPTPPPRLALSILEFCGAAGISEDFFYKLKRQGQAPRLAKVGSRTLITVAAANEWLVEREHEAASAAKADA
jgi:hypothetical protein